MRLAGAAYFMHKFPLYILYKECSNECKDCVELGERSVNHSICLHIVTLSHTNDTICTNLTLTNSREEAYKTYTESDTEPQKTGFGSHTTGMEQECQEAIKTLCCGQSRENHITR